MSPTERSKFQTQAISASFLSLGGLAAASECVASFLNSSCRWVDESVAIALRYH